MYTYCSCTVYTILLTFVQFVLYQQILLEYSRMLLLCVRFYFLSPPPALNEGRGKATEVPYPANFLSYNFFFRKQGIYQIEK